MTHGTLSTYANHKCRCDACRAAQSEYMRAYKERRQANGGERLTVPLTAEELAQNNRDRVKAWRKANPDKHQVLIDRYQAKNREAIRERNRDYWRRSFAENPDLYRERHRAWKQTNQGRAYQRLANYRRRSLPMSLEVRDWWLEQMSKNTVCAYCWAAMATEIDHIIPVTKGGTNELDNLVPACRSCNASKNNKTLDEWIGV